jgi:hypothetical protein
MNRKLERQSLPPRQVLPITPGPALVPLQALPVTPLSTREEALTEALTGTREQLRDANDMGRTVLQYYGTQRADRTARARQAGSTPKQKITTAHTEMVEVWLAEMEYREQHSVRAGKRYIDRLVGKRFGVGYKTVERARLEAGYR